MSKKTENIYKSLAELTELNSKINDFIHKQSGKVGENVDFRVLEDIEFNIGQQVKNLKFWIDSLYAFNGKSTSRIKQNSSRENGKKGGRPPKIVTELRRRKAFLEDELIPELEHNKSFTDDLGEISIIEEKLAESRNELIAIEEKLNDLRR